MAKLALVTVLSNVGSDAWRRDAYSSLMSPNGFEKRVLTRAIQWPWRACSKLGSEKYERGPQRRGPRQERQQPWWISRRKGLIKDAALSV